MTATGEKREYLKRWYAANKKKFKNSELKKRYGISSEQYDEMFAAQDQKCAICRTETPGGRGCFHVDHDHDTGKVRGLLCHRCNTSLGGFGDSVDVLRAAIAYLSRDV
jgi:hypothetical protein